MNMPKEGYDIFTDMCYPKVGELAISDYSLESVGAHIKTSIENITGFQNYGSFLSNEDEMVFKQSLVGRFDYADRDPVVVSTIQNNLVQIVNSALLGILHDAAIPFSQTSYFEAVEDVYKEKELEEKVFSFVSHLPDSMLLRAYVRIPQHISNIFGAQECPKCFLGVTAKGELQEVIKKAIIAIIKTR